MSTRPIHQQQFRPHGSLSSPGTDHEAIWTGSDPQEPTGEENAETALMFPCLIKRHPSSLIEYISSRLIYVFNF